MTTTSDELTDRLNHVHLASVPLFARQQRTPDIDADKIMRAESFDRIAAKLTPSEMSFLAGEISRRIRAEMADQLAKVQEFIFTAIALVCAPRPCLVRAIGLVYALDAPEHMGLTMAEHARRLGVSRASLSNAARDACRFLRLQPSRWMRADSSADASKAARIKVCQTTDTTPPPCPTPN